jgi:RimJ/RimL family protein N-acetyltransferase
MKIRKSTAADLPRMMEIYAYAREFMAATGNPHQWGDGGNPRLEVLEQDIEDGVGYVMEHDGRIVGAFAFIIGEDETYGYIEDGAWLNDEPYHVIHRIAVAKPGKGYARLLLDWAFERTKTVRIDTHRDNVIMHHILQKYGFQRCGVIYLANGDARDAYQMIKA